MADKREGYYGLVRHAIMPLLPKKVGRILYVGCGYGNTLSWIKEKKGCEWTGGVEIMPAAAEKAKAKLDMVYHRNIENIELPISPRTLDIIL